MRTGTRSGSASVSPSSVALIAALLAVASPARADKSAPDCPTASEEAQRLRDKNHYLEAREMFRACSAQQCPKVVRSDCAKSLAQLEESLPTIVVAAQDSSGADLKDVRVQVDGRLVTSRLDGSPIPVDPGEHDFAFAFEGAKPIQQSLVIRVSEKNRLVRVTFVTKPEEAKTTKPEEARPVVTTDTTKGGAPTLAYVLGGIGIVGLGGFAYFGLTSKSDLQDLRTTCSPYCEQSQLDDVKSKMLIADVSLGVGIVALGIATVLFLTHSSSGSSAYSRDPHRSFAGR